jgi:hypothetical protein
MARGKHQLVCDPVRPQNPVRLAERGCDWLHTAMLKLYLQRLDWLDQQILRLDQFASWSEEADFSDSE